jgi:Ca2+-binding EF-hand superfamily protein
MLKQCSSELRAAAAAAAAPAVQAALRLLGLPAGKHYLSDLYQQYDKDRSEEIDYEEFKR